MTGDIDLVTCDVADGVATLTLNRGDAGNALNMDLVSALRGHVEALAGHEDVRVVVLRSVGKMFCVGGDLGWMTSNHDREAALRALADELHAALLGLRALPAPVVAVVQGTAAGAGLSLAAFADVAIAGHAASFVMSYTKVGLSPDGGSTWMLPRLIGTRRTAELILLNPKLGAQDAVAAGLITRAVPDDELQAAADAVIATLRDGSFAANSAAKALLNASPDATFTEQLEAEAASIATLAAGPEGREGVAAFLERRTPDFHNARS